MTKSILQPILAAGAACLLVSTAALAHIEVDSGAAVANATNEVVFSVAHGCSGADTNKVVIDIPAGVTSVRPMRSDFAMPTVTKDAAGNVTNVTWQKPAADALDSDFLFYRLTLRFKTPNAMLSTIYFVAHQTCRAADGTLSQVDWADTPATPEGQKVGNPAAALKLVPARIPGWNKVTVPAAIPDLSVYFSDAQIVWKDTAAYSANADVKTQIAGTSGVTALTSLNAGDVIWVKY